jgi:threonine dehydratase
LFCVTYLLSMSVVNLELIQQAAENLKPVVKLSDLQFCERLSKQYQAEIYLKREDQQLVRSFKIRGAYNLISSLNKDQKAKGVVCASAGNHAQGVAFSCKKLQVFGTIFMPLNAPMQKINRVKNFGGEFIKIELVGQNFDEASFQSREFSQKTEAIFVHAFDNPLTIAGQGTIGLEIMNQMQDLYQSKPDYIVVAVGGGGLIAGITEAVKSISSDTKIISGEVDNQASMHYSITQNKITELAEIGTFVDGTAVNRIGNIPFEIAKNKIDKFVEVSEGRVCSDMIDLYQSEGIITEPSGALAVSSLDKIKDEIKGKKVVCVICGGNNDISRYPDVLEKSLVWKGLKHYFVVNFNQKPGELKKFLSQVLGPQDDIVLFEYIKKTNREKGGALVGIQIQQKSDYQDLIKRLQVSQVDFQEIKQDDLIYKVLI